MAKKRKTLKDLENLQIKDGKLVEKPKPPPKKPIIRSSHRR